MKRGSRIVAIDAASAESVADETAAPQAAQQHADEAEDIAPEAATPLRRWPAVVFASLALLVVAGWTVLFAAANLDDLLRGGSPQQWAAWIRDWSLPVLLVAVLWLVAMRSSRREAVRFGASARMLAEESALLEGRLAKVNHELSLAREFITAQTRDLETLGRVAGDRISEHADRLAGVISDNGTRIDAIGAVSEAALENMEKLRFQLPVIASSAKDVTNNIGAAGRTAQDQLGEMVQAFDRLNQFGQASETRVNALRDLVESTLGEFAHHAEHLETTLQARFVALTERGEEFRTSLDGHEVEALAAVRTRATALADELVAARELLDSHEAESLTSLRARLTAVRDESAAITRSLREGESTAIEAWHRSVTQLEADLRTAVANVSQIDEKAMQAARNRLAGLAEEADQVDARMIERDRLFAEEIETRRAEFVQRHADFSALLTQQMAALDTEIAARRGEQEDVSRQLVRHSETIATQLATYSSRMGEIANQGREAEATIAGSLDVLADKLAASRDALRGTDETIAGLTDGSVRLLELIRAGVRHSEQDLPAAIAVSEARLQQLAENVSALRDVVKAAEDHGEALAVHVGQTNAGLELGLAQAEQLGAGLAAKDDVIAALHHSLGELRAQAADLAGHAQGELSAAIEQLNGAAHAAVLGIENMSAEAVSAIAGRIGDESGAAVERAMRLRAAEVAGQLEQAAAHAAGVSREAAMQMRDQLGKVNELAG
ncbi:MAG: hypothetical protein RLZZ84_2106, partial [Pseudomonadota bacterium]